MKKLIISIVSIILVCLLVLIGMQGISIGSFTIPSVSQLQEENDDLNSQAQQATLLASTSFTNKKSEVDSEAKKLEKAKSEYSDLTQVSTDNQMAAASQIRVYDIGKLWTKYGNYAKREGIVIDIVAKDLQEVNVNGIDSSTQDKKTYLGNLSFTAYGSYVGIEEFVTEIEDDTELGFRIENFKMVSNSSGSSSDSGSTDSSNNNSNSDSVKATFDSTGIIITGITTSSATQNDHNSADGTADGSNSTTNGVTNSTATGASNSTTDSTSSTTTGSASSSASTNTTSSSGVSSSSSSDAMSTGNVVR